MNRAAVASTLGRITNARHLAHRHIRSSQNLLALVPLALMLGEVTEDLALRFGTAIGALLNVTFGNSVELILSVAVRTPVPFTVKVAAE